MPDVREKFEGSEVAIKRWCTGVRVNTYTTVLAIMYTPVLKVTRVRLNELFGEMSGTSICCTIRCFLGSKYLQMLLSSPKVNLTLTHFSHKLGPIHRYEVMVVNP